MVQNDKLLTKSTIEYTEFLTEVSHKFCNILKHVNLWSVYKVVQKVQRLTQKEELLPNIFVVATHYAFL